MKSLSEIQQILHSEKPHLIERFGVEVVGLFGSYVRNEQRPDSDIDILINLARTTHVSLLDLVDLEDYLSETLGVKADIALKNNLRKRISQRILAEVVPI